MQTENYTIKAKSIGEYDLCVAGGGIAGACAAISAARLGLNVILIERAGSLGGTLTEGFMPIIHDSKNKGGIVRELYAFLDSHGMTAPRFGKKVDENGKRIPGIMVDTEGCKYFFDKAATEAGVKILFHSQVAGVKLSEGAISSVLVVTECETLSLSARLFVDATGNGQLADFAGCEWDFGDPAEGQASPTSLEVCATGLPEDFHGTDNADEKTAYGKMLADNGIEISATQGTVVMLPSLSTWTMGMNFQYGVRPDDTCSLTRATLEGRRESFEVMEAHKRIPGYERLTTVFTSAHIGIREGRRIYGEYRLTDDDILEGRRFDDGICLVTFGVDVHKLSSGDTTDCKRGYRTKPYNIPYRALIAKGVANLFLAGRCISGDFYPHASYRVMGNMAATGEAVGFAAAECIKNSLIPKELDGRLVKEFMMGKGYEL